MINHARTLLLNISGTAQAPADYPGEEYVPKDFVAQDLTANYARLRNVLFHPNADRALCNYRLRQYLALVHSTELSEYIYALDPRVTYWPSHDRSLFLAGVLGAKVFQLTGSTSWQVTVIGSPANVKSIDRLYNLWELKVLTTSTAKVTNLLAPETATTVNYTVTSGVTSPIPLTGSTLSAVLNVGTGATLPTWQIRHIARPLLDVSDIYSGLTSGVNGSVEELFEIDTEPFSTCRKLWGMPRGPIAYKMGALIVAFAYRLNELYQKRSI